MQTDTNCMNANENGQGAAERLAGSSVLIVEDDAAVARVMSKMLSTQGCRVEVAEGISEAGRVLSGAFDAVVLDVDLPDGSGFDLVPALHTGARPTGVVVVTGNFDKQTVDSSIRAGISECLRKPFSRAELVDAVAMAVRTSAQWRARMAEAPEPEGALWGNGVGTTDNDNGEAARESQPGPIAPQSIAARLAVQASLTGREEEVLDLMLLGKRNTEIATALEISVHTVKYHARNTLTKLGSESRMQLFRTLAQDGLLE